MNDRLPPKEMCSGSRDLFKYFEIGVIVIETVQDRDMIAMEMHVKILRLLCRLGLVLRLGSV